MFFLSSALLQLDFSIPPCHACDLKKKKVLGTILRAHTTVSFLFSVYPWGAPIPFFSGDPHLQSPIRVCITPISFSREKKLKSATNPMPQYRYTTSTTRKPKRALFIGWFLSAQEPRRSQIFPHETEKVIHLSRYRGADGAESLPR